MARLYALLTHYAAHDDPLTAQANRFSLLLASNQPFYPLYVWWLVGEGWMVSLGTLLSTPFFLAVPWLARRSSLGGRLLLAAAAVGNTFLCMALFGENTLVGAFLAPCAVLIALMFRRDETRWTALCLGAGLAVFLAMHGRWPAAKANFSLAQLESFAFLHIVSAACLVALIAWLFAGRIADVPPRITK